jgi:hypothetical protein
MSTASHRFAPLRTALCRLLCRLVRGLVLGRIVLHRFALFGTALYRFFESCCMSLYLIIVPYRVVLIALFLPAFIAWRRMSPLFALC